jgi:hypothetical protein
MAPFGHGRDEHVHGIQQTAGAAKPLTRMGFGHGSDDAAKHVHGIQPREAAAAPVTLLDRVVSLEARTAKIVERLVRRNRLR